MPTYSSTLADVSFLVLRPKYINFGPQVASAPTTKINAADPNVDSMKLGLELEKYKQYLVHISSNTTQFQRRSIVI